MKTKLIEATNGFNWGKFLLMQFDEEWEWRSQIEDCLLLKTLGWNKDFIWILDLQTGEGAFFRPGGSPTADLHKHRIWVCLLYEPLLQWLYTQDLSSFDKLPGVVTLDKTSAGLYGYRRPGLPALIWYTHSRNTITIVATNKKARRWVAEQYGPEPRMHKSELRQFIVEANAAGFNVEEAREE